MHDLYHTCKDSYMFRLYVCSHRQAGYGTLKITYKYTIYNTNVGERFYSNFCNVLLQGSLSSLMVVIYVKPKHVAFYTYDKSCVYVTVILLLFLTYV